LGKNVAANILAFSVGISIGWASPSLQLLQSNDSPLGYQITSPQASLISSLLPLGALFGTLLFGSLSDVVGRYWSLLLVAIPQTVMFINISKKRLYVS
jgi:SP family facilitated glucose transporter-like MFS transporter 8